MTIISGIIIESFRLLGAMAPYLLFGFLFAGILKILLPEEKIASHLGEGKISSSIKASLIGIPLPLCSCGVIPAAVSLRKQGANKGATLSFLISTPTTGVDSILATYSLLGPLFTAFRVATSFVTAVFCGIISNIVLKEDKINLSANLAVCNICGEEGSHAHNMLEKIRFMFHYAFWELLEDVGKWVIIGIIIGGVISYMIPDNFVIRYLGSDWKAMIIMLLIGIPIYVCATGSIPIVAALMLKGMSPGAGLVFLLAGPATNTVTITVIARELGKKAVFLYLIFISIASIAGGLLLNMLWSGHGSVTYAQASGIVPDWLRISSAIVLVGLILLQFVVSFYSNRVRGKVKESGQEGIGVIVDVPDMNCQHCVRTIKEALKKIKGVEEVEVDLPEKIVKIYSGLPYKSLNLDRIIETIVSAGFKAYLREK